VLPKQANLLSRDVSPDGRFLLARTAAGIGQVPDIWAVQLDGNPRGEFPVVRTPGFDDFPQFSPDERWVAYQSNESGQIEIYLQQFPSGRKLAVSSHGGVHVRWRPDGKELFYIAADGKLMAVAVDLSNSDDVRLGTPAALFTPPIISNAGLGAAGQQYLVSKDGQRFLIETVPVVKSPLTIIRKWQPKS